MLSAFLTFIQSQELVKSEEKILCAVSGGLDSVAMVDLLKESGFQIGIAHCNFQLRGKESEEDSKFVRSLAEKLGVPFYSKSFDTAQIAEEKGISLQMAARELRYGWFDELIEKESYDKLAVAHHKDDQIETILFNFTKGTGIAGLTGMQSLKGEQMIRPLLFTGREDILMYARERGLMWREDSSNESLKYHRNLIRQKILPVLKEINPGLLNTLDYTLLRLTETESVLNEALIKFLKTSVNQVGQDLHISKASLKSSLFPTLAIHAVANPFGFNYQQCINIFESIDSVGNVFYTQTSVINVDREEIILSPIEDDAFQSHVFEIEIKDESVTLDFGSLQIEHLIAERLTIEPSPEIAYLDLDKLNFPLKVRHWASGDWFIPLGMKGKKKVSDLMIDEKIPVNLKNRVLILESAGDIAWVIGYRIDNRYKIVDSTERVWKARYEKI